jgi:hypothetical protein
MKTTKIVKVKTIPIRWVNEKHDTDRDGLPNYKDCNPWNPHEQGLIHDIGSAIKQKVERFQDRISNEQTREKRDLRQQGYTYFYVLKKDDLSNETKWVDMGPRRVTDERQVYQLIETLKQDPSVVDVKMSNKPLSIMHLGVAKRAPQWQANIQQGLKTRDQRAYERKKMESVGHVVFYTPSEFRSQYRRFF